MSTEPDLSSLKPSRHIGQKRRLSCVPVNGWTGAALGLADAETEAAAVAPAGVAPAFVDADDEQAARSTGTASAKPPKAGQAREVTHVRSILL